MNKKTSLDIKKTASIAMLSALAFLARLVFKIPSSETLGSGNRQPYP